MFLNQLKTVFLLGALSGLLLLLGRMVGGTTGIAVMFVFALLLNFVTYFFSDKIVLRLYGAKALDKHAYPDIYEMVAELAHAMNMPMPKLWLIPTPMANAFATGRNPRHASVAVTQGILSILEPHELRGVLAHELSHVKNRDILIGTIAATIAMTIGYIADMIRWSFFLGSRDRKDSGAGTLIVAFLMPVAALLIQLAISRSREYLADETGATCCHDPLALASALEKLSMSVQAHAVHPSSNAQTATASLFIVYPFSGNGILNLFSTHPPMKKRIARLRAMAR